jgi:hypothetical protein
LKHGFYSTAFQNQEIVDLETTLEQGLDSEIAMMRVITRRVVALMDGVKDLDTMINALGALGSASAKLASLLRTQKLINGNDTSLNQTIAEALNEVVKELGIKR